MLRCSYLKGGNKQPAATRNYLFLALFGPTIWDVPPNDWKKRASDAIVIIFSYAWNIMLSFVCGLSLYGIQGQTNANGVNVWHVTGYEMGCTPKMCLCLYELNCCPQPRTSSPIILYYISHIWSHALLHLMVQFWMWLDSHLWTNR